ncbi:MAG: tail fiber domain-containing protein [Thalassotalea sp.]
MNITKTAKLSAISLAMVASYTAQADQVIQDSLIVVDSICVGMDCVNGENFGFDTLRLKENNLRIRAVDTSTSASFPTVDWQLTFNEAANGGINKFSVDDLDAATTPLTIEASAPNHSLYIKSNGYLGLGTSTPIVNLHLKSGNTPTLRLEQDGSSGFTSQAWDVAGNEANFFVRDATNGSKLPFRIRPGAPTDSLFVAADGDIGFGTTAPSAKVHAIKSGAAFSSSLNTTGIFQNNSASSDTARVSIISGDAAKGQLAFGTAAEELDGRIRFDHITNTMGLFTEKSYEALRIHNGSDGNLISSPQTTAVLTTAGVWQDASSRELKKDIKPLTASEALNTLEALDPVTYIYKADPTSDLNVGFIAEDVPEIVATSSRKSLASLDIIAILTKVAQDQRKVIADLSSRIQLLEVNTSNND